MSYLDDYKGQAHGGSMPLEAGDQKNLPDNACKFVQLHRWNVTDDEAFTVQNAGTAPAEADTEIYYGYEGVIVGQLFASQATALIPVNNTNQITIRIPAKGDDATVFFTFFK